MRLPSMWFVLVVCVSNAAAFAEEPAAEQKPAASAAAPDDIAKLIADLDANRFSERQTATEKLAQLGKAAIPALAEAAENGTRETTQRSLDVLKRHFQGADEAVKGEAKQALEKLSKSANEAVARKAADILKPKPDSAVVPNAFQVPGGIQIGGGQIQIQVQAQAGGNGIKARRVTARNVNGDKEIEADDGDRKVKIKENNDGIKIEVTTKKDGQENTEKFEAKNIDELKKNHPDAAKIYDEFAPQAGNVQVQGIIIGQGGAIQAIPGGFPRGLPQFNDGHKKAAEQLQAARKQLEEARERVKKLGADSKQGDEFSKALAELEAVQQQLEAAAKELERN